ncbi:hypothetical protein Hanom_Chr04g00320421 [Helianthus anomalus]
MEIGGHSALDWGALDEVDESARARLFIGHDTPWERYTICYCFFFVLYTTCILTTLCDRLFDIAYIPSYRVMTCELSTFDFAPRPEDQPGKLDDSDDPWIEVRFRLAGQWHVMPLRQFT